MDLKGKHVLILGLARSGVAATIELTNLGAKVTASDMKSKEELKDMVFRKLWCAIGLRRTSAYTTKQMRSYCVKSGSSQ